MPNLSARSLRLLGFALFRLSPGSPLVLLSSVSPDSCSTSRASAAAKLSAPERLLPWLSVCNCPGCSLDDVAKFISYALLDPIDCLVFGPQGFALLALRFHGP